MSSYIKNAVNNDETLQEVPIDTEITEGKQSFNKQGQEFFRNFLIQQLDSK